MKLFSFTIPLLATTALCGSLVDRSSPLEKIPGDFELADGPAWDGRGQLYIPDVKAEKLYRYRPTKKELTTLLPEAGRISATFFNHGRLYLSDNGNARISWLKGKDKISLAGQDPEAKPPKRPNDLVVDQYGGVYYTLTRQAQVIYISNNGEQNVAVTGIETANGITLSPDGATLYVASYVPKKIWAYQIDAPGKTSNAREFAVMDDGDAKGADGMCIDRAGNVYCAGATAIWIWSPSGKLMEKIETPERPINCTFGDSDLRSLYITGFGGLYRQRMNTYGLPALPPTKGEAMTLTALDNRPATRIPENVDARFNLVFAEEGERKLLADLYTPMKVKGPLPGIVVVHGGGWKQGYKDKFQALGLALAEKGFAALNIEYRLAHEAKFPAGIQDCNAAVRFLRANASSLNIDPERIGAVGGSAGGHLVGLMATGSDIGALQGNGGHAKFSSRIQAAVVMAGPLEITTGSVAERSRLNPDKANINLWTGKDFESGAEMYRLADAHIKISEDDPPILFMAGEYDHPERNEPSREILRALNIYTDIISYPDGKHGCWNQLPWFNDMVNDIANFFNQRL